MLNLIQSRGISKPFVTLICCLALAACVGPFKKERKPVVDPFLGVKTIQVTDKTEPLLLASTDAGKVREFVEIALKHHGYLVCRECQHDAQAVVTIHTYQTSNKRDLLWMGHRNLSKSEWSIVIVRNGNKIFSSGASHEKPEPISHLSARQVRNVIHDIPLMRSGP